jgi:hypothetical protein
VDVGYGQLAWTLRQDPRVRVLERRNARYLSLEDIGEKVDLAVIDTSFISLKNIIPPPLAIVKALLMDLFLPVVGNVTDVIQLFKDIRDIVTAPLSASSLDEFWTSLLKLLDIPILIYKTVTSILMRTLALPLLVASFIPHPVVKAIAAAVGYGLLGMFIQSELVDIGHKVLLLKTGKLNKAEKEKAYNHVGDSIIGLIMTGVIIVVMLILHFIASVVKGIYNFVKGKVFGVKAAPVEAKGPASGEGKGKGKGDPEERKGTEGKGPKEGTPSEDGKRKIKMNEEGRCEVCASPCDEVRKKYSSVMTPEIEGKIKLIEGDVKLTDPQKEVKLKPIEQELSDLQARASGNLIGDLSSLTEAEATFVREQLAAGKKVEIIPTEAGRTPDFKIDGKRVELKTISGVADTSSDGISKAIANRVMNGRGQSTDILVDVRGQAGITQEIAERGVKRAYGADIKTGGKITSIRVIGPGFDITIPRI